MKTPAEGLDNAMASVLVEKSIEPVTRITLNGSTTKLGTGASPNPRSEQNFGPLARTADPKGRDAPGGNNACVGIGANLTRGWSCGDYKGTAAIGPEAPNEVSKIIYKWSDQIGDWRYSKPTK